MANIDRVLKHFTDVIIDQAEGSAPSTFVPADRVIKHFVDVIIAVRWILYPSEVTGTETLFPITYEFLILPVDVGLISETDTQFSVSTHLSTNLISADEDPLALTAVGVSVGLISADEDPLSLTAVGVPLGLVSEVGSQFSVESIFRAWSSFQIVYATRKLADRSLVVSYKTFVFADKVVEILYVTRSRATKSTQLVFTVSELPRRTLALRYSTKVGAAKTTQLVYKTRAYVGALLQLVFATKKMARRDVRIVYKTAKRTTRATIIRYGVRVVAPNLKSSQIVFGVRSAVSKNVSLVYDVEIPGPVVVSKSLLVLYHTLISTDTTYLQTTPLPVDSLGVVVSPYHESQESDEAGLVVEPYRSSGQIGIGARPF